MLLTLFFFNKIELRHRPSGRGVEISGDFPLASFSLYIDTVSICPEPFMAHIIASDATLRWTRTYRFF